jgi:ATP-dependent Clp protease adaptor protein ClpS
MYLMSSAPTTQPDEQVAPESAPAAEPEEEQAEPASTPETQTEKQAEQKKWSRLRAKLLPPYKVILFNDDYNEMDFVVAVLLRLVSHMSKPEALRIMLTAHLTGSAVVVVCPKENAEHYQERLLGYGLTAAIEPD